MGKLRLSQDSTRPLIHLFSMPGRQSQGQTRLICSGLPMQTTAYRQLICSRADGLLPLLVPQVSREAVEHLSSLRTTWVASSARRLFRATISHIFVQNPKRTVLMEYWNPLSRSAFMFSFLIKTIPALLLLAPLVGQWCPGA